VEYDILYSRLATAEKLPDRFLNVNLKGNTDLSKSHMGEVFCLVEIMTPWFPTAQIGQTIINTFTEGYYNGQSTSDLSNFENALKKVNVTLAEVTQNGETDWLGNLNAILGVVIGNKIHLSQTGKAECFVFRDGKINNLTEGLAQSASEPHPLSTFSNVTSGELKPNDKLLLANPDFYKNLSMENIRQIVMLSTPPECMMQIAKLLKKKKVSTVNVMLLNLMSTEELAKLPPDTGPETIYLDKPLGSLWNNFLGFWRGMLLPLFKFTGSYGKKAGTKSVDFTKNYLATLHRKHEENKPVKKSDLYEKEFINKDNQDTLLKDEEITYSPELDVHYYNEAQKEKRKNPIYGKIGRGIIGFFNAVFNLIKNAFQKIVIIAKNKKTRPYFFVGVSVVLLIIIGLVINSKSKTPNNFDLNQAQTILKQAETDEQNAEQALLSKDNDKAKILFSSAIDGASKIQSSPIVGNDAKNVINKAYTQLDKLTSTTRYSNIKPVVTNSKSTSDIFVIASKVYMISQNTIYSSVLSSDNTEKVASVPSGGGDIQFGTVMGDNIYLYTSSQKIYEFETSTSKINPVTVSGTWETANAITSYTGTIYLLDGVIGQIYKHTSSASSFAQGQTYINATTTDIKTGNSIAVDGYVYILKANGEVMKFQKSKQLEYTIKDIPAPHSTIEKPVKLFTDSDTPSVYILDNGQKRILEFDKSGQFIHQYAIPDVGEISDFTINTKAKKMWVLAGNKVYEISI
jgi:hypothetical protein